MIRRLSFDLTGLPPTPEDVAAFLADPAPDAYERLVDRLLASPRYGERWARHWLDLVRYAETAGHEFDYDIPNAFRYRDYVIRAFNADLPYDQFVIEQIAGDLLEPPRRHPAEGFNESILGTGFYFLGEGTHSPVDVREEQMRRIDNQIDVLSKTFLGLTRGLCPLPRPQVRPDHQQGLLRPGRVPPQLAASAGVYRSSRADRPGGRAAASSQENDRRRTAWREGRGRIVDGHGRQHGRQAGKRRSRRKSAARRRDRVRGFQPRQLRRLVRDRRRVRRSPEPAPAIFDSSWPAERSRLVSLQPGQAHSGMVSDRLRGVLALAQLHDRGTLHPLAGRGARRQDQRRRRRLREDPRSDLRRP